MIGIQDYRDIHHKLKMEMPKFKKYFPLITSILVVLMLSSCAINLVKSDQANQALRVFLEQSAQGEYDTATTQYAGGYVKLVGLNPDLNANNHAAQSQFEYRVVEGDDGQFQVLDMPVYIP